MIITFMLIIDKLLMKDSRVLCEPSPSLFTDIQHLLSVGDDRIVAGADRDLRKLTAHSHILPF